MSEEPFVGGKIPKSHPGEVLREDFLLPSEKTVEWLADGLRMPLSAERTSSTATTAGTVGHIARAAWLNTPKPGNSLPR